MHGNVSETMLAIAGEPIFVECLCVTQPYYIILIREQHMISILRVCYR